MKNLLLIVFVVIASSALAQKIKKADKAIIANLQSHISFLADDKLEGRRAGSNGEKTAYEYISAAFEKAGIEPKGDNSTYLQAFEISEGRFISPSTHLLIDGHDLAVNKEFFPLSFCPNQSLEATASPSLQESGSPWFFDIKDMLTENSNNPHFSLPDAIKAKAAEVKKKGATALFVCNSSSKNDELKFEPKAKTEAAEIPVIYITAAAMNKYMKDETSVIDVKLKIQIEEKKRYGHNVIGLINNNAPATIIVGAHYDHLGYGEDHNSLYTGTETAIHNGADDNASGTAALLELGKMLKASKFKNNNYLLIAFSGEELGLFGSKYFTEHSSIDLSTVNYMINMDMVGRLNDSSRGLTIGGYGTSPVWSELITKEDKYFTIKTDSSGTGPSDHTSFYRKDIPVLFFFTGLHSDYHKPSDDADKINYTGELFVIKYIYKIIEGCNEKGKLAFTKTREAVTSSKTSFKVTLGIMPDYTFSGSGVRVDGVSEGKIAQKAGIKAGDVVVQLGTHSFSDVQGYMEALSKFKKGDATKVKVKRGNEELLFDIVF